MQSRHSRFLLAVLIASFLMISSAATAQEATTLDWRFGVVEAYEAPREATTLGASWTRISFHWGTIQAGGSDTWTPEVDDAQIEAEVAAGREVLGLLIGMPGWAQDDSGLPRGLYASPSDPANLWATFVRTIVARYQGRVDHWVIWNEPDIWDPETPGHTWDGTVADFARLQEVAYRVAKEANPQAIIHLAAFTYFWDANYGREQYFERLLEALLEVPGATRFHTFFDVATAHLYFNAGLVYEITDRFREMMTDHGVEKPIWLVETNAPPSVDPAAPAAAVTLSVTLEEQAAFMPQGVAAALAAGAERIAVYKLKDVASDAGANPEPFGLLRRDGSRRLAFTTYRQTIRYLSGVRDARRERWDEVGQFWFDQGAYTTTVLFARLPIAQQAEVPANATQALLVDMWGTQRTLLAENDLFSVSLPPALCTQSIGDYCMIGGTTYFLVQPKTGETLPTTLPAVMAAPTPLPPPTVLPPPAPTPTATWTPTPSLTPAATHTAMPTATATVAATAAATSTSTAVGAAIAAATPGDSGPTFSSSPASNDGPSISLLLALAGGIIALVIIVAYRGFRQN